MTKGRNSSYIQNPQINDSCIISQISNLGKKIGYMEVDAQVLKLDIKLRYDKHKNQDGGYCLTGRTQLSGWGGCPGCW